MKRTQIMVKEEQHSYLAQQAAANNTSISEVIRKLIDEKMKETIKKQAQGGIQMAETAIDGPSECLHHDEVLYK